MSERIDVCPFCGGEPILKITGNDLAKSRSAKIKCKECNANIEVAALRYTLQWCIDEVRKSWNKRIF